MKSIETSGKTVDQAIELGLYKLETTRDKVKIDILTEGGLFDKAKVKITLNESSSEEIEILELVNNILKQLNINCSATVETTEDGFKVDVSGEDAGAVIGKRGDTIDALQYMVSQIFNKTKSKEEYKRISIDCEKYRERRVETLKILAVRLASKAIREQQVVKLEAMNAFERMIIHTELQKNDRVSTESKGEEPNRYLTIIPKRLTNKDKKEAKNNDIAIDENSSSRVDNN
ncbi:MAG: RNA-binding cell elongation regulator Jag/EloR [Clostridia bacterium]